ncbi:MAG: hypothetical protein ACOCUV_01600 [bacterium]
MQFVYVLSDFRTEDDFKSSYNNEQKIYYLPVTLNLTKNCLISLIKVFEKTNFGLDTIPFFHERLDNFKKNVIDRNKTTLFLDSGGFSFIKGKIDPYDTAKMIECYVDFLNCYPDSFDYIFSLDIPINRKRGYEQFNSYDFIKKMNYKSLKESVEVLNKNPALIDKFYYVRHFIMRSQYKIWSELYNDNSIGLKQLPVNNAIGGLVKSKAINELKFSPSIAIAYKCLFEYLNNPVYDGKIFKLHFLGVNEPVERLTNTLIEALFDMYLKKECLPGASFTYDTLNYDIHSTQKIRNLNIFKLERNEPSTFISPLILPDDLLKEVYVQDKYVNGIKQEIEFMKADYDPTNVSAFYPLSVFSNLQLDKYAEYLVNNELLGLFDQQNENKVNNEIYNYCTQIKNKKYVQYFKNGSKKKFETNLKNNLKKISKFHNWFMWDRSETSLEDLMLEFIDEISAADMIK